MAVEIEAQGQLQEFLEILKKRKWQVILPAIFALTLGSAFAVLVPKKYTVDTQVELRDTVLDTGGERASTFESQMREAQNAHLHITAPNRIRAVIEHLKWTDYLGMSLAERNDYIRATSKAIKVTVPPRNRDGGSAFVTIEYRNVDPVRAVEFLEQLRDDWTSNEVERGRRAIEAHSQFLNTRRQELAADFQARQNELSRLQSSHGISPTQPVPGGVAPRNEDPRFDAHNRKLEDRERVAKELSEAEVELEALREQILTVEPEIMRYVTTGEVDYSEQIKNLELKLDQAHSARRPWRQTSTSFKSYTRQIEDIELELASLRDRQRRGEAREEWDPNPVYTELSKRLRLVEVDVKRLTARLRDLDDDIARERDELRERYEVYAVVRRESDELERLNMQIQENSLAYERNLRNLELITGPAGNPFQITSPVAPPRRPSEPDPWLIAAFSLVAGIGVGLALAVLAEYSKSCFRSAADISRVMVVPVLGVVNTIRTRAELRRDRVKRLAVGVTTALLVGVVSFITWAWAAKQDLLSPWVLEQIEEFRKLFV